ncbi:MAG: hypothetical protein J2P41_16705, partial [Blastocatellia bacterium]|nr:hypothetical protein [Blastocatellia bacterium]
MSIGNSRNLINAVNERARTQQQQPKNSSVNGGAGRAVDVVANTHRNIAQSYLSNQSSQDLQNTIDGHLDAYVKGIQSASGNSDQGKSFVGEAISSAKDTKDAAVKGWSDVKNAKGPLGKVGAVMNSLTGIEQALSEVFSAIPFPAMPAARVFDLALGFPHGHTHPPTYGAPLPSIGPVIPLPWGISGAENTTINGRKAARCGDMGIGVWCGGYFPIYEILLGSSSVWIEGCRAARMGVDLTLHCTFSEFPEPKDIPEVGIPLGLLVTASENVIIGGFPLPSLVNMLMGGVFKLLGKGLGKLVRVARKAAKKAENEAAKVAEDAAKADKKVPRKPKDSRVDQGRSVKCNDPVDIASGRVFASQTDFELAGPIPIEFSRVYDTSAVDYEGPLGWGWMHAYDIHLWVDDSQEMIILRNEEALPIGFNQVAVGEKDFNIIED